MYTYVHAVLSSSVQFFVTLWTVASQTPPFMVFSRQEYWSRLPCPPYSCMGLKLMTTLHLFPIY